MWVLLTEMDLEDKRTNLTNAGGISADRGTETSLVLTIPRSIFKSSTKDLCFPKLELVIRPGPDAPVLWAAGTLTMLRSWTGCPAYAYSC